MALHFFSPEVAEEYGVNAAILLQNLSYWIEKNRANDRNYIDGMYWTYSSVKAFQELFPYLTARAISTALQKLEDAGIIISGNHNKSAYDRTKWYAITEKGFSILQNRQMENSKSENGNDENDEPIPYNITDNKKDIIAYNDVITSFNEICADLPRVQKVTEGRKKAIRAVLPLLLEGCEGDALNAVKSYFRSVQESDFLCGRKTNFKASFDWLMKKVNAVKVIEGNYSNARPKQVQNDEKWGEWL